MRPAASAKDRDPQLDLGKGRADALIAVIARLDRAGA
jgi:hypothetical protein